MKRKLYWLVLASVITSISSAFAQQPVAILDLSQVQFPKVSIQGQAGDDRGRLMRTITFSKGQVAEDVAGFGAVISQLPYSFFESQSYCQIFIQYAMDSFDDIPAKVSIASTRYPLKAYVQDAQSFVSTGDLKNGNPSISSFDASLSPMSSNSSGWQFPIAPVTISGQPATMVVTSISCSSKFSGPQTEINEASMISNSVSAGAGNVIAQTKSQ